MGNEDIRLKVYLEDKRRYADLWNGGVFEGREVVKASQLLEANPVLHKADKDATLERNRDLVMKQSQDGQCFAIFTVENQEMIDYSMPARIMLQEALEYNRQIKTIAKRNKAAGIYYDSGERLYKFRKDDRLHPVVTLVVYWGEEEWTGAKTLHDMIDFRNINQSAGEELKKLVPEYPLHFLDLSTFEHFEYFKTELRPLLELFKRRNNKREFVEYIEANEDHWNMDDESWYMLSQLTHSQSIKQLIKEKNRKSKGKENGGMRMCKAIEDLKNDARAEGIATGRAEGIATGRAEGIATGRAEGIATGRAEGIIAGKIEDILELLEEHGKIPDELKARISAQKDLDILRKWIKLAAQTTSIQAFAHSL